MKKILIMGSSSYVGRHLFARLGPKRAVATYYRTPIENGIYFDAVSMNLWDVIRDPETISHAVILLGDTDPDSCAKNIAKSQMLNVESIKGIIESLKDRRVIPVFASSEFVFDGEKGGYAEEDIPNPILTYGKQKVEVERYLQRFCDDYIIVRLAKVFGSQSGDGTIFTNWLNDIRHTNTIRCASDQIFSPIYIDDVVENILNLIGKDCRGIFHIASDKPFARIELLRMLLKYARRYLSADIDVIPCSINDFNLLEKRPLNVSMVPKKLVNAIGIVPEDVECMCAGIVKSCLGEYEFKR